MTPDPRRRVRAIGLTDRLSERDMLDRLIEAVRAGESQALVVRGDAGVGKTVLLDYLAGRAPDGGCQVARATGVQSEMELAFAGLHQLCGPMLSRAERLPVPQRDALRITFGLAEGPPPDRFFVGLALLNLLSEAGRERPLICLVDDQQWLDRASAQALGFAGRRLAADPVGLVFAAREPGGDLAGLPELEVGGLRDEDARALLVAALTGPLDAEVRDLIVAETRGNPLALLELPRGLGPAELAGGFGLPGAAPLTGRIEDSFARQLAALSDQTRRLVQLAAADPSGDRSLVWRAAGRLGIPVGAGEPAEEAGLVEFGGQVRFRHPLARSAAYRSAALRDRRQLHAALAEATDPIADPDRRAWHRAQAAAGPDEEVAAELERSAGRAQARGGLAAAAAFLERSVLLTVDSARRAERALAAAQASFQAGAFDASLGLAAMAEDGPLDEFQGTRVDLRAISSASSTASSRRSGWRPSPSAHVGSFWRRARRCASTASRHASSSRRRRSRSPDWPATACRIRRSAPGCSCPGARSSTTWARSSESSASAPAGSCARRWRGVGRTACRPSSGQGRPAVCGCALSRTRVWPGYAPRGVCPGISPARRARDGATLRGPDTASGPWPDSEGGTA